VPRLNATGSNPTFIACEDSRHRAWRVIRLIMLFGRGPAAVSRCGGAALGCLRRRTAAFSPLRRVRYLLRWLGGRVGRLRRWVERLGRRVGRLRRRVGRLRRWVERLGRRVGRLRRWVERLGRRGEGLGRRVRVGCAIPSRMVSLTREGLRRHGPIVGRRSPRMA
jgi:hypothetical protein